MNKFDFRPATLAGVSCNEFAKLFNALEYPVTPSRMTAYNWFRGNAAVSDLFDKGVGDILKSISIALEKDELPLPPTCRRAERFDTLLAVIKANM